MSSANGIHETAKGKLHNPRKKTRINNILIFNIFQIKWPKSEEKINFGGRWVWLSESSPTQNFVVTPWPWPHLCRPAAAASGSEPLKLPLPARSSFIPKIALAPKVALILASHLHDGGLLHISIGNSGLLKMPPYHI